MKTPLTPTKTKLERLLYLKWFPIFRDNQTFTEQQINEYKLDLKKL